MSVVAGSLKRKKDNQERTRYMCFFLFFFSSRRRHTRCSRDWSSDVCSSDLTWAGGERFDAGRPGGPSVRIDGKAETGPGPVDTLVSALASCAAIDVVEILADRKSVV